MKVNPFVPSRSVRIVPSSNMSTMVAAALTYFGAACIALSMSFLSAADVAPAFAPAFAIAISSAIAV